MYLMAIFKNKNNRKKKLRLFSPYCFVRFILLLTLSRFLIAQHHTEIMSSSGIVVLYATVLLENRISFTAFST